MKLFGDYMLDQMNINKTLQREVIKHHIKGRLKVLSRKVIEEEGYKDMAEGVDRAIDVIDDYFKENEGEIK